MAVMDDVCAQMHGVKEGADRTLKEKLSASCGGNKHFQGCGAGFAIHHYAGRNVGIAPRDINNHVVEFLVGNDQLYG